MVNGSGVDTGTMNNNHHVSAKLDINEADLTHPLPFLIILCTVPSGTPGELLVSHSLPTSAQLSWTPVPEDKQNDTITGYIVQVEGPDSTQEIPVIDGNATSYEVSDLRPYTTYTFGVSAITEAGAGPTISIFSTTPQGGKILCWTSVFERAPHKWYSCAQIVCIYTVVSWVNTHAWAPKHNLRFWPAWALTRDQNSIRLYRSCCIDPLKWGTWALTREWALAQDTTVHV